jgi:riboflavin kinase/FMN adenylyltransferase
MIIHKGIKDSSVKSPVVTMGIFDGVHTGHKLLLSHLKEKAEETGGESVVITFSPHPRLVLEKDHRNLVFLTTTDEKIRLLEAEGIDHLILIDFTLEFSRIEACEFIKDYLIGRLHAKHLIVGYDHHFGRQGSGNFETIKQCSAAMDFRVEKVEGLMTGKGAVSSTMIREALLSGKPEEAKTLLGYSYSITGEVVEGRKLGRSIGYPTANIRTDVHKLIPSNGVYATEVIAQEKKYPGMLSIGTNPTVNSSGNERSIEVHIIGFNGNLYGEDITLTFRKRLRDEQKFSDIGKLAEQMDLDRADTLKLFRE